MRSEKGFSLIELLITIAIAATLSVIAILYIPGMVAGYRVSGATRFVYGDMQMARLMAIKEGQYLAVEFTGTTAYCIKKSNNNTWTDGCTAALKTLKTVDISGDYSGVTMGATNITSVGTGNKREVFYPNGKASGGRLELSKDSRTKRICITTGTGRMRILDGSGNCT